MNIFEKFMWNFTLHWQAFVLECVTVYLRVEENENP